MTFVKQPIELKDNPWLKLEGPKDAYVPLKAEQKDKSKWYFVPEDEGMLKELSNKEDGMYYNLDPQPWLGKWNVNDKDSLPRLVVLSLNPGIDDFNFVEDHSDETEEANYQRGKRYNSLMKKWFRGEASASDILFDEDFRHYNGDYWIGKMWNLCCEICNIKGKRYSVFNDFEKLSDKEQQGMKDVFNKILFVDLFPYHSKSSNALKIKIGKEGFSPKLKSMEFTEKLLNWLMQNEVTFIYARSQRLWELHVKDLERYKNCYSLSSPQNTCFSKENCCTTRRKYSPNNPNISVYEEITKILTK